MSTTFRILAFLGASCALACAEDGRLPSGVKPVRYALRLEPSIEQQKFGGRVEIELELAQPTRELVLNSLELRVTSATADGAALSVQTDDLAQQLKLTGTAELPAGPHKLVIEFSGTLHERPEGLYLTRYQLPDGTWQKALVTQMEPADARRMFPCWDEPSYRSAFQLTAIVPAKHTALFNMPITRETVREGGQTKEVVFAETPPMASYLVAFVSAELESIEDEVAGTKLRILTTPGRRDQMRYAMEATKKVVPYYNDYFGVKYPLPKLDQVSFPSVGASGMENWGCIIYADGALLFDDKQSSQGTRERVFDVVAHEIAHQWFGDLVTMEWWDDLWLNEGFASWMATKASDHFNPAWKKWERAASGKEGAMRLDARATTHPIQQVVSTAGQAEQAFDEITYQKGQALLRMLETWLGEEKFRAGLRSYFAQHAYRNTTTDDLWKALALASGQHVEPVASGWTEQPGFPVVKVSAAGEGKLELQQERFTIHQKNAPALRWQIPVSISLLGAEGRQRVVLLGESPERIPGSLPAIVNTGAAGYFRTSYSSEAWAALKPQLSSLSETDRVTILNDVWADVQAQRLPISTWLELAETLRADSSPLVLERLVGVVEVLDHLARGTPEQPKLRAWAREFFAPLWQRLGWDAKPGEDLAMTYLRAGLVELLGEFGEATVRAEARARGLKFLEDSASLPGDLRTPVLHLLGREAGAELWERLHTLALKTADTEQKSLLYGALAAARDPALAARALETSLTGELPSKTAARMVGRVASEGEQPELAWKYAGQHLGPLLALCSAGDASRFFARLAQNFSDAAHAGELETLSKASLPPDAARDTAIAVDEIRFKAEFKERVLPEFARWLDARQGGR